MGRIAFVAAALVLTAGLSCPAQADSSFTVYNELQGGKASSRQIDVVYFDGNARDCPTNGIGTRVKPGKFKRFGCQGRGEDQCKVALIANYTRICTELYNSCRKDAVTVPNGYRLTVSGTVDKPTCDVAAPSETPTPK